MKKIRILNKVICILLSILFISQPVLAYAQSLDRFNDVGRHEHATEEIYEADGILFYFRITEDYVYSSQLSPLGIYNFAIRYNNSNAVTTGKIDIAEHPLMEHVADAANGNRGFRNTDDQLSVSSVTSLLVIENLNAFATEVILFDMPEISTNIEQHSIAPLSNTGVDPIAAAHLRQLGYSEHRGRFLGTHTQSGVTATLLQDSTFFRVSVWNGRRLLVTFIVGATAAAVSAFLGIPPNKVKMIANWIIAPGGYWILSRNTNIYEQRVAVAVEKLALVSGVIRFIQYRSDEYHIFFGDEGASHRHIRTIISPSFNNNTGIMQEAIRRHNNGIWITS